MLVRTLIIALITSALPAHCQPQAARPLPEIPLYAFYDSFFTRVAWLDDLADTFLASGRDDSGPRHQVRREAGLSADAEAALVRAAKNWRTANESLLKALRSATGSSTTLGPTPGTIALQNQRQQQVLAFVAQVQSTLGPATFKLLDVYVRRTSTIKTGARNASK